MRCARSNELGVAEEQAATDRDLLVRLVRSGRVKKVDRGHTAFTRDIQRRAAGLDSHETVNLAIRPKGRTKKGKRK